MCFEFWLLIHFEYTTAGYTSCDDLLHNSRLREKLSSIGIKDYEKGLPTLFDKLKDKVNDAMKNSEKLKIEIEKSAEKDKMMPHKINPYLDIHEMFIDMDNFINKRKSIRKREATTRGNAHRAIQKRPNGRDAIDDSPPVETTAKRHQPHSRRYASSLSRR